MGRHVPVTTMIMSLAIATGAAGQIEPPPGMSGGGMPMSGNSLVQVSAVSTVETIRPGEQFHLAFTFRIEPSWHIYWLNPGDSGSPTDIVVEGPDGFEIGDVLWPRPEVIRGEMLTIGYELETTLFVPVTAPPTLADGEAVFTAEINWLVCREQCLMGDGTRTVRIPTRSGPAIERSKDAPRGEEIRSKALRTMFDRVPAELQGRFKADDTSVSFDGETLSIEAPARDFDSASWLHVPSSGVTYGKPTIEITNNRVTLTVPVTIDKRAALGRPMRLEGILMLGERQDDPAYHLKRPVDATNPTN